MTAACSIRVRGVVQGVGFRPFVYRLAREHTLAGWVLNAAEGVEIHLEGEHDRLDSFVHGLRTHAPPAAAIATIDIAPARATGAVEFVIRDSQALDRPTTRIAPDLGVCDRCVGELLDPGDARHGYPYINCTDCGPRYSIILSLPYDRAATTMAQWRMDDRCARAYLEPSDRRFHAQPVACPTCGPHYALRTGAGVIRGDAEAVQRAAACLREGLILAIKGIGGYHLACDARNETAVRALRERKFRKEKPFAVMVRDLAAGRELARLSDEARTLLESPARPIVLVPARVALAGVAPDNASLGLILPYTPLHHLLFAAGAPASLVLTSANRSSEPIAYEDAAALEQLDGVADGFLMGERPIARRVEDSVARVGPLGTVILRRGRGYAPTSVVTLPTQRPILALGADLKNSITLVVDGQAFVSQHIGDLDHYEAFRAFQQTIDDLSRMYEIARDELLVVRDLHPQYRSATHAPTLNARAVGAVQHHRAHIASVVAERGGGGGGGGGGAGEWDTRIVGVALDGTGYGDDGTIWGGEIFVGSVREGLDRVAHLRPADLVGGDAAAKHPVQAAAGFLNQLDGLPALSAAPFHFPSRYQDSVRLLRSRTRTFVTTSAGRLFDAAAALVGFTRPVTFEGQAAMWLEHLAATSAPVAPYDFPFDGRELDFRPLLRAVIRDRIRRRDPGEIARAFHAGFARGMSAAVTRLCAAHECAVAVVSGGVFQNELLLADLVPLLAAESVQIWGNHAVPPNDGGISLGQAALAAFGDYAECTSSHSR